MVAKLRENFEVEDLGPLGDAAVGTGSVASGRAKRHCPARGYGAWRLPVACPWAATFEQVSSALSERQRALDVVQLHKLVLEDALGMSEDDIRNQKHLKYVRDAHEAIEEVRNGANVAFIMNPVRMEQMRDVAFAGEVLPQKSTDFYPKLLSGLTIYSLEEAAQRLGVRRAIACGFAAANRGSGLAVSAGVALLLVGSPGSPRRRSRAVVRTKSAHRLSRHGPPIRFPCWT